MLNENTRIRTLIPAAFDALIGPHVYRVDLAIQPGINRLSWTSLNLDTYIENVYGRLGNLELLLQRANDLVEFRIDTVLRDMSGTSLCQLPEDESLTMKEFSEKTQVRDDLFITGMYHIYNTKR